LSWHIDSKKICHALAYCTSLRSYINYRNGGMIFGKEKLEFSGKNLLPTTKYTQTTVGLTVGLNSKKPELWHS
jgi:hypothetical protein